MNPYISRLALGKFANLGSSPLGILYLAFFLMVALPAWASPKPCREVAKGTLTVQSQKIELVIESCQGPQTEDDATPAIRHFFKWVDPHSGKSQKQTWKDVYCPWDITWNQSGFTAIESLCHSRFNYDDFVERTFNLDTPSRPFKLIKTREGNFGEQQAAKAKQYLKEGKLCEGLAIERTAEGGQAAWTEVKAFQRNEILKRIKDLHQSGKKSDAAELSYALAFKSEGLMKLLGCTITSYGGPHLQDEDLYHVEKGHYFTRRAPDQKISSIPGRMLIDLGYFLEQGGRPHEAVSVLMLGLQALPNDPAGVLNLADAYFGMQEKWFAESFYRLYLQLSKNLKNKATWVEKNLLILQKQRESLPKKFSRWRGVDLESYATWSEVPAVNFEVLPAEVMREVPSLRIKILRPFLLQNVPVFPNYIVQSEAKRDLVAKRRQGNLDDHFQLPWLEESNNSAIQIADLSLQSGSMFKFPHFGVYCGSTVGGSILRVEHDTIIDGINVKGGKVAGFDASGQLIGAIVAEGVKIENYRLTPESCVYFKRINENLRPCSFMVAEDSEIDGYPVMGFARVSSFGEQPYLIRQDCNKLSTFILSRDYEVRGIQVPRASRVRLSETGWGIWLAADATIHGKKFSKGEEVFFNKDGDQWKLREKVIQK